MNGDRHGLLHHAAVVEELQTVHGELARAKLKLGQIKSSASYQFGCDLQTEIDATLADPQRPITELDATIDAVYTKLRRQELERRGNLQFLC